MHQPNNNRLYQPMPQPLRVQAKNTEDVREKSNEENIWI
jgi:hypothetical protein